MRRRWREAWPLGIALTLIGTIYLLTLQRGVVGICEVDYCADIGEFQVALPLWGTVHHTGYPLYMLLGSPFVTLWRWVGVAPTFGASLFSFAWMMLALAGLMYLIDRLTDNPWLAGAICLAIALIEPIWVYGVVAEVYATSMAFAVAILCLTVDLKEDWSDRRGWLLAFVAGLGVAHHRLLIFLILGVALYLLPTALASRSFGRWLGIAVLAAAAGFLPYADVLLRMRFNTVWTYQQANTWQEFVRVFSAQEEAKGQLTLNLSVPTLWTATKDSIRVLFTDLAWPGILLSGAGLLLWMRSRKHRALGGVLFGIFLCYAIFPVILPRLSLTHPSLMVGYILMALILAVGVGELRPPWQIGVVLLFVGWAAWLGVQNWPTVTRLTGDRSGVRYAVEVEAADAPPGSVVMAPWGSAYFILAYAHLVEGRMADWQVVDHRADFQRLTDHMARPIYTHASTLYIFGREWWAQHVPEPLNIASAGPNVAMLTAGPPPQADHPGLPLGDGIELYAWAVHDLAEGELQVTLEWTATQPPSADYSAYVHATDKESITQAEDILAQSDAFAPVYGYAPTSGWLPGALVREDHVLTVPPGREIRTLVLGMYRQEADGSFRQLGTVTLGRAGDGWGVAP